MNKKINNILILFVLLAMSSYFVYASVSSVGLITPTNQTWDLDGDISFSCNATPSAGLNINNITLYVWNESGATTYNTSLNTTAGATATTVDRNFTLTSIPELQGLNYTWNCLAYDNESNSAWGSNYTFGVDTTVPTVTLISPANNSADTDGTVTFTYNVTDVASNISNCSVYLEGLEVKTNSSITKNSNQTIEVVGVIESNTLPWYIGCYDNRGRQANSSSYYVDTLADSSADSPGGSNGATNYQLGSLNDLGEITK
jgi:hypothetical protein